MALVAMSRADTIRYVAKTDPAYSTREVEIDPDNPALGKERIEEIGDNPTYFLLRGLDVFLMGWVYDSGSVLSGTEGSNDISIHTRLNKTNIEAVRFGIVGFSTLR